jgi:hypothetical protein
MLSEDYLIRMIRQAAAVMAKIIGLKKAGDYQEALQTIDQTLEQLLGMNAHVVHLMDDESLYKTLTLDESLDLERLGIIADLYWEEADILGLQEQKTESINSYIRSLNYYLTIRINSSSSQPKDLSRKIEEITKKLADVNLPEKTMFDLFCYYENEGKYKKAEKILAGLTARPEKGADIKAETISFYKRLLEKSPMELSAGGMNVKQIRRKLKGL